MSKLIKNIHSYFHEDSGYLKLLLLAIGILFTFERWNLDIPHTFPLSLIEALTLVSFFVVLILILVIRFKESKKEGRKFLINTITSTLLFIIGLGFSISYGSPVYKSYDDAAKETSDKINAAVEGSTIFETKPDASLEEIKNDINQKFPENKEQQDIAIKAFEERKANPEKSQDEVTRNVSRTVPVKFNEWTCNDLGCSYGDENGVWTVTQNARVSSTVVNSIALLLLGSLVVDFSKLRVIRIRFK